MKFFLRKSILIVFGILSVVGTWYFMREYSRIKSTPGTAWVEDHKADCAVVLTGGPFRVREGLDLLSRKDIRKLVIAGTNPGARLREIFPEWPYYGNLDENDVILEKNSKTTYGNAMQTLSLMEALNCRDIVLITSRVHMHRAYRTFRAVFPKEFPIYQRAVVAGEYVPNKGRVIVESIKSLFYRVLWFFY